MMIRNIQDLAQCLGARDSTERSIQRRIFKDTSCGCSSSVRDMVTGHKWKTYVVEGVLSITGLRLIYWRPHHGKKRRLSVNTGAVDWRGYKVSPMPIALAEYLLVDTPAHLFTVDEIERWNRKHTPPTIGCSVEEKPWKEFNRSWLESLGLDEQLLRVTIRGTSFFLTVRVKVAQMRQGLSVAGYCEGSDMDHSPHTVAFPCHEDEVYDAISKADKDGCETWDMTHGCIMCHTSDLTLQETLKGWRVSWDNGDSWWKDSGMTQYRETEEQARNDISMMMFEWDGYGGIKVNPECKSCGGSGAVM